MSTADGSTYDRRRHPPEIVAKPSQRWAAAAGHERVDVRPQRIPPVVERTRGPITVDKQDMILADVGTARIYIPPTREADITIKAIVGVYIIAIDSRIDGQSQLNLSAGRAVTLRKVDRQWYAIGGY